MKNKVALTVVAGVALALSGVIQPQAAKADFDDMSILTEDSIIDPSYVVERPVMTERVVESPAVIERVIEKPVVTERIIEKPVVVEQQSKPVVIETRTYDDHPLLRFGLFDLLHLDLF